MLPLYISIFSYCLATPDYVPRDQQLGLIQAALEALVPRMMLQLFFFPPRMGDNTSDRLSSCWQVASSIQGNSYHFSLKQGLFIGWTLGRIILTLKTTNVYRGLTTCQTLICLIWVNVLKFHLNLVSLGTIVIPMLLMRKLRHGEIE